MSDQELISSGFNIDTRYRSQVKNLRTSESEYEYYIRSKETMKKIIKLHGKTSGTILLVAHAPSLEVLTRHLMNGQPRPEQLSDLSARVGYCSMTIVDSEPSSKTWRFRYSLDEQTNLQQLQLEQANSMLARSPSVAYQPMAVSQFGYFP
jgi:broad specificity phosphatase PhoE